MVQLEIGRAHWRGPRVRVHGICMGISYHIGMEWLRFLRSDFAQPGWLKGSLFWRQEPRLNDF